MTPGEAFAAAYAALPPELQADWDSWYEAPMFIECTSEDDEPVVCDRCSAIVSDSELHADYHRLLSMQNFVFVVFVNDHLRTHEAMSDLLPGFREQLEDAARRLIEEGR